MIACLVGPPVYVYAADKVFSGAGDAVSWNDAGNWFPQAVPATGDAVRINNSGLSVRVANDFAIGSLTIGGKGATQLTVAHYVYATITPSAVTSDAVFIKKNGTLVLSGPGTLILRGALHNSEDSTTTESSVLIWLQ
jgi:hypothetical protein